MNWIFLELASELLSAGNVVLAKATLTHRVSDRRPYLLSVAIASLPFAGLGVFYLATAPLPYLLAALFAGIAHISSGFFYYRAMSVEKSSHLSLLFRLGPVFTLVLSAIFIHERLTTAQYAGFGISFIGGVFLVIGQNGGVLRINRSTRDALMTSLMGAILGVLTVYLLRHYTFWQTFLMIRVGAVLGTVLLLGGRGTWNTSRTLLSLPRRDSSILLAEQIIRLGVGFLHTWAVAQIASASLVAVLSGLFPLYVWLIAVLTRQEPPRDTGIGRWLLALALFVIGALLMSR